jgi:hypothetical protein
MNKEKETEVDEMLECQCRALKEARDAIESLKGTIERIEKLERELRVLNMVSFT